MTICPTLVSTPMTNYLTKPYWSCDPDVVAYGSLRDLGFLKTIFGSTLHAFYGA